MLGVKAEVDSGRVEVRRVIAVGLDLSVTEERERGRVISWMFMTLSDSYHREDKTTANFISNRNHNVP